MSWQISHGKYTLFLAGHFVRFRALVKSDQSFDIIMY